VDSLSGTRNDFAESFAEIQRIQSLIARAG